MRRPPPGVIFATAEAYRRLRQVEAGLAFAPGICREAMDLLVNAFAQIIPDVLGHGQKNVDDLGVELSSLPVLDFGAGCGIRLSRTISAVRSDGVESIRDREDARSQWDLLALQTAWVPRAVIFFLMGIDDFGSFGKKRDSAENLVSAIAMFPHGRDFFRIKLSRLEQDGVGDGHFAKVVEEGPARDDADLV